MLQSLRVSHVVSGFVALFVGYTGSVAIVFQAAESAGATQAHIDSWLLVLGLGLGFLSIGLSLWYKAPILTAWSTPGAALLISNLAGFSLGESIGAFVVTGFLILVTGISGIFARVTQVIPAQLANALLAGILIQFGIEAFAQLESAPWLVGSMLVGYFVSLRFLPRYAVPVSLAVGCTVAAWNSMFEPAMIQLKLATPVWTTPEFSIAAIIGVSLPLYFVTMASQNVPGLAVLRSCGYQTPVSPLTSWTGLTTVVAAPFGGFTYNLAAITAAICAGKEAGENPDTRYLASVCGGVFYILAGIFGATIATLMAASPAALILSIAGIALFSTIGNSLAAGIADDDTRMASLVTILIAASGVTFLGIGAAFWAIVGGMFVWLLTRGTR